MDRQLNSRGVDIYDSHDSILILGGHNFESKLILDSKPFLVPNLFAIQYIVGLISGPSLL